MIIDEEENSVKHYGTPRKSGRYPWGSGENPYQRNASFLGTVDDLRKQGLSEAEIARSFEMTTTQLRALKSIAKNENRAADISQAQRLKDKGWSNVAIGDRMGLPESSVRALLAPGRKVRADAISTTSNMLKDEVEKKGLIDIGAGVENQLGISKTKLKTAVAMLKEKGYKVHYLKVEQLGTGHETTVTVLSKPDVPYSEVYKNRGNVKTIESYSDDGGSTFKNIQPPTSVDSKRIQVRYAEDSGTDADGVIYVRPGVEDVSLGNSSYAQVRIAVDGSHYLKGMAMYSDDMPDGVDLVFNTSKRRSDVKSDIEAMKPLESKDPDNPFGSTIVRQSGVMNILREEGDWRKWQNSLSSQMLSKQSPKLAKQQLDLRYRTKQAELEEIMSLTNPNVKRRLLAAFADDADSSAVHLKAAALPRQSSHVILPVNSLKTTEIYAPNYKDGERVALIRFPHGGIFEIPELTVNNRHRDAKSMLGNQTRDAVGINSKVAERLSGADFDGDTVLVIPNNQGNVKSAPPLEGLKDFDPRSAYPGYEGMSSMTSRTKQIQMGDVSNLITDMTIRGASANELARAVRHSMVVIDAEKHKLNWKQSQLDNGIPQLKEKYQGGKNAGASTLVSKAGSQTRVPDRKKHYKVDPETGEKVWTTTDATYVDRNGKTVTRTVRSTKAAETDDLHTLSSGTPVEEIYADYGNGMKSLANTARKASIETKNTPYSPSAKAAYSNEVASLNHKLNVALKNAPRERQAQLIANSIVDKKRKSNPDLERDEVKKLKFKELEEARTRTGAARQRIEITPSEWEAIQAGAITNNKLSEILNNADLEQVKELATPRSAPTMTSARVARAKSMAASGYTQSEIAEALGVSVSTITNALD